MPITFMGSNGDGLRKLVAVDNIMIRTMKNDSIIVGQEPETDMREVDPFKCDCTIHQLSTRCLSRSRT